MADFKPLNLTALQIGVESGGRQFDDSGKPLRSPKGAVGIGQVMPETGPEAARLAGLPWDPKRFENDREYNLRLADAYQGHLNTRFDGDRLAAVAAYNAGPTRVAKLRDKYGSVWATHLPNETKEYVKKILGVDVNSQDDSYYKGDFVSGVLDALNIPTHDYKVKEPTSGENANVAKGGNFPISNPSELDTGKIRSLANKVPNTSERYSNYLDSIIEPLRENATQLVDRQEKITGIKRNLVNDFAVREAALEAKVRPLMARKHKILEQLDAVDQMNPLEQRFKSIFSPERYDPRMLRGQLERLNTQISEYESDYKDLNALRSGVATASVDAETADANTLSITRDSILADANLLGQVVGATKAAAVDRLFPLNTQVQALQLTEATKSHLLGTLSLEKTTALFNEAEASPDGTVTVDGVTLTVGELQSQSRTLQQQDLSFRSMINAFKLGDMRTLDQAESFFIDHMSSEQVAEALKNDGKVTGPNGETYTLSPAKLAAAAQNARSQREEKLQNIVNSTAVGLAHNMLQNFGTKVKFTDQRLIEMFGNRPGTYEATLNTITTQLGAWRDGLDRANEQGVGKEYLAQNIGTLTTLNELYEKNVSEIANQWAGGKSDVAAVAESYIRGNPISGDLGVKGLVTLARSGLPAGARLSGPAAQAFEVAQATVREWDNPQAGDSLESLLKGGTKKDSDLYRVMRDRIGAVYADGLTNSIINDLPKLARSVHDPENPNRLHPFSRVSREDFIRSVQYGDSQGLAVVAKQMEVTEDQAKAIFSGGIDSPEWKAIAAKKGYTNGDFTSLYEALVTLQMTETLSALDASHSAAPGFSPAKAYIDFLSQPEVTAKVGQDVNGYGRASFGAFLISSSVGGSFQDAWQDYVTSLGAAYNQSHSAELRERIKQQRSLTGDPFVRMNAVLRAADLTPQESQALMQATKPLVHTLTPSLPIDRATGGYAVQTNRTDFDSIRNIIQHHKFDDPTLEKIRKKAAANFDAMDTLVGTVFDSVSE